MVLAIAVVAVLSLSHGWRPIGAAGALATIAFALAAHRAPRAGELLGRHALHLMVGMALLALAGAGVGTGSVRGAWQPVLAVVAYPFLCRALLGLVRRYRLLRDADVLVEAALVATAVGIVLHVSTTGSRAGVSTSVWGDTGIAFSPSSWHSTLRCSSSAGAAW